MKLNSQWVFDLVLLLELDLLLLLVTGLPSRLLL
jgi:hypothetical protein